MADNKKQKKSIYSKEAHEYMKGQNERIFKKKPPKGFKNDEKKATKKPSKKSTGKG